MITTFEKYSLRVLIQFCGPAPPRSSSGGKQHRTMGQTKIQRVLIANRAEIASRIIKTCTNLGLETIAVYTTQDAHSAFWREATHAIHAGDITISNPYTNPALLVSLALKHGADAIHPGYGYLSENPDFCHAVEQAGLVFIGPREETIRVLGDKAACKAFLRAQCSHVPLIPGSTSRSQDPETLLLEAKRIGLPVLPKASAGGGGKGMRIVSSESEFVGALGMTKSEAIRHFGSDDMLLEKFVTRGKHIEVQIFGDTFGHCAVFGDRECTIQRRHQKVIEEAPSSASPALRATMESAAREICAVTGYRGAGTVEFIVDVDEQKAYFLEVNTRIQVEHPITEEIFGVDLVALQIYVADGGDLSLHPSSSPFLSLSLPLQSHTGGDPKEEGNQGRGRGRGHAIEMRLCAENPAENFVPQTGLVTLFQPSRPPPVISSSSSSSSIQPRLRYESSIQSGDTISIYFDPMICKIIVWAPTRLAAISTSRKILAGTICLGITTNANFMGRVLNHPVFRGGAYVTSFIGEYLDELLVRDEDEEMEGVVCASILARCAVVRNGTGNGTGKSRLLVAGVEHYVAPSGSQYLMKRTFGAALDPGSSSTPGGETYSVECWRPIKMGKIDSSKFLNKEGGKMVQEYYSALSTHSSLPLLSSSSSSGSGSGSATADSSRLAKRYTIELMDLKLSSSTSNTTGPSTTTTISVRAIIDSKSRILIGTYSPPQTTSWSSPSGSGKSTIALHPHGTYSQQSVLHYYGSLSTRTSLSSLGGAGGGYVTPMPCKILRIERKGGNVEIGDGILVMESMKTEVRVVSRSAGVLEVKVREGDVLDQGVVLCTVVESESDRDGDGDGDGPEQSGEVGEKPGR